MEISADQCSFHSLRGTLIFAHRTHMKYVECSHHAPRDEPGVTHVMMVRPEGYSFALSAMSFENRPWFADRVGQTVGSCRRSETATLNQSISAPQILVTTPTSRDRLEPVTPSFTTADIIGSESGTYRSEICVAQNSRWIHSRCNNSRSFASIRGSAQKFGTANGREFTRTRLKQLNPNCSTGATGIGGSRQ